jgi:hypothetical protein
MVAQPIMQSIDGTSRECDPWHCNPDFGTAGNSDTGVELAGNFIEFMRGAVNSCEHSTPDSLHK